MLSITHVLYFVLITTTFTCAQEYEDWQLQMLDSVNNVRAQNGKAALALQWQLNAAAQAHSDDQAAYRTMSHTGSDGSDFITRIQRTGFRPSGGAENVAAGQQNVAQVMESWITSAGHFENLMGDFQYIGVGMANNYWTQVFTSGSGDPAPTSSTAETPAPETTEAPVVVAVTTASTTNLRRGSSDNVVTPCPNNDVEVTAAPTACIQNQYK